MATAMILRKKSSPLINHRESFSPGSTSSIGTLSPHSSQSVSSPDRSLLLNQTTNDEQQQQQQQPPSIRLIDYFVVAGLEKHSAVEPSCEPTGEQVFNPFQRTYRCRVLSHFPQEISTNSFDEDAISRLSMPDGVAIRQNSPDPPRTHSFLITRLDGTRYYGVALTFFEQLNSLDDGDSSSISSLRSLNELIQSYQESTRHPRRPSVIYVSKAICLIGCQPHYSTYKRILELLYRMTIEHDLLGLPFEAHLCHLLHELYIPSPSQCHSVLKFSLGERQLTVWQPSINDEDLPLLDFHLLDFFSLLGVSGVVDLVTCALLEHQIILKSSDYNRLMLVAECLTALLFPFQWTLLYVPIVFTAALVCLDVPVPAIMGIRTNEGDDGSMDEATFEVQRCVVQIDQGQIQLPDDMPRFPDRSAFIKELNEILSRFENTARISRTRQSEDWTHLDNDVNEDEHQPSQALTRLAAIAQRTGLVLPNANDAKPAPLFTESELIEMSANNTFRAAFVNRFAQLFCQIDAFICYPPPGQYANVDQWLAQRSTTKNFDRAMFIADQPKPHVPFLLAFMETQSFVSFIDTKIASKFNEDQQLFGLTQKHLQFFSNRIRLYRERRDLTYQTSSSVEAIEEETRRRFTPPLSPSLVLVNAPPVRPLTPSLNLSTSPFLFESLQGSLLESSTNVNPPTIEKRNSRMTRSFHSKHSSRRATRMAKQQTVATGEHHPSLVVLVENEVVFQQLLKECTTKVRVTRRSSSEKLRALFFSRRNEW